MELIPPQGKRYFSELIFNMIKKINEMLTKTDVKFWMTIVAVIVSVTVWGVRLEGRLETVIALQTKQEEEISLLTQNVNSLWQNVIILNTLQDLATLK